MDREEKDRRVQRSEESNKDINEIAESKRVKKKQGNEIKERCMRERTGVIGKEQKWNSREMEMTEAVEG